MSRPQCSVFIGASLDGFIARADGSLDWLTRFERSGEDYGYREFFASVDAIVVGRNTYDLVLGFDAWPYAGKRCVVLTHREPVPRHDEIFFTGEPAELLAHLERDGVRRVYVDGANVVQQFLAAGLVDDLTISVIPIVLGDGVRLFADGTSEQPLVLESSRAWPSGLVQLRYRLSASN